MSNAQLTHSHPPSLINDKQAVEVVATFGDAVVGVRHLTDPRGGVVTKATKALLAGGVALLATSAIAFGWAASVAAKNQAGLKAWMAKGKPAWAYRPQQIPMGLDPLTLGGSALGIGAIAWGLARRKNEKNPARVRLGTAAGSDFPMEGVGASFDLVSPVGDGFAVNVAPGMLGAPVGSIPVSAATKLRLQLGATTFHIQSVAAPKKQATGIGFDRRAAAFFAASAVAHLGILALLQTVPSGQDTAAGDDTVLEPVAIDLSANSHEVKPPDVDPNTGESGGGANGVKVPLTILEGMVGANTPNSDPATGKHARHDSRISQADYVQYAKEAGIFASDTMHSDFSRVTGQRSLQDGMDDVDIYGGEIGTGDGLPVGTFGTGRKGPGPGGPDQNSIFSTAYNVLPPGGPGPGDDYNLPGDKKHPGRPHVQTNPTVKFCSGSQCETGGDADPAVIRRYIKRSASKISYCYDKALLSSPGLQGTVSTTFMVMPDGHVMSVQASGVSDDVSSCIAGVLSNIKFPAFKSAFQVKYPFFMHPAG